MKITKLPLLIALFCLGISMSLFAADAADTAQAMPPMGPPDEIKAMSDLIGTWDVVMDYKMAPTDTVWVSSKAVSVYSWAAGGGAIIGNYDSEFMGMPFIGHFVLTYNRDTKMYQTIWVDNMGAKMTYYEGTMIDGKQVMSGKALYMGAMIHYRIITWDLSEDSFQWAMEQSMDDGKTFTKVGKATYTRKK